MKVGILGGTGSAGRGLARRLAGAGHEVQLGSRDPEKAQATAEKLGGGSIGGGSNSEAASFGEVVVLAVPWDSVHATLAATEEELAGRILLSMANALVMIDGEPEPVVPPSGSLALGAQTQLPRSHVVAALHHVPARELEKADTELDFDVLTCGDHRPSLDTVVALINSIRGLRAIDAGGLVNASAIEALTPVLIGLNLRHRARTGIKINGLPV